MKMEPVLVRKGGAIEYRLPVDDDKYVIMKFEVGEINKRDVLINLVDAYVERQPEIPAPIRINLVPEGNHSPRRTGPISP